VQQQTGVPTMTQLHLERKLQPLEKVAGRRGNDAETVWYRFVATVAHPEFIAIVAFCAIGLLVTVNVILRFPDFGATFEQFGQFP
jgi:hypothetical protein